MANKIDEFVKVAFQMRSVRIVAVTGAIGGGIALLVNFYLKYKRNKRRALYPKDTVILHQPPRGYRCPSASPFALKLETWLRMASIPYQNEFTIELSQNKTIPWITLNGVDYTDSQFIIELLSKKLNKNLNQNLDEKQQAISRCLLKTCEESLRWVAIAHRFLLTTTPNESGIPRIFIYLFHGLVKNRLYNQGYGRHSKEDLYGIGKSDLNAINNIIGDNQYALGNTPTDVDAALFGILCQILYHDQGPLNEYLKTSCPNILRQVENIKKNYWSDWNDNITNKIKFLSL